MNHIDLTFAARAFVSRRGIPSATVRHRRLLQKPLAVVAWQLGGEQFSFGALGWGNDHAHPQMAMPGEPRNRDLFFAAMLPFAKCFNEYFEAPYSDRETITTKESQYKIARTAPQIVVPNCATAELLGRLGRRLAYLPLEGSKAADPAIVKLGRHLKFLWDHHAFPGQQLIVALTDLMNAHWATPQSVFERQSLPALDAFIDPPTGMDGFGAAAEAEFVPVGPTPDGEDDERLMPLVERFNELRKGNTDPAVVTPLKQSIEAHYRPLLRRAWDLLWRCRDREMARPEAVSVGRRWDNDRQHYTWHMDWFTRNGLRRTRQTPRQAARTLMSIEEAGRLVRAEEACDDPLRMASDVLANKAVRGQVVAVDANHKEQGPVRMVRRPLVTLRSPDPCFIPVGRELWWTGQADGKSFVVENVTPRASGGADVILKLMTSHASATWPTQGIAACFSIHTTEPAYPAKLPEDDPWTHVAPAAHQPVPIEDTLTTGA